MCDSNPIRKLPNIRSNVYSGRSVLAAPLPFSPALALCYGIKANPDHIPRGTMLRPAAFLAIASLAGALIAAPAGAQQDTSHPGGVTGAAHDVSAASKATGRSAKAGLKSAGSSVHKVLKKAGRGTKSAISHAVGDTIHDPNHKPGGLNKVARDVSGSIKHVGRAAKAGLHEGASETHKGLQKTGNAVKKSVKDTSDHR
jgi:hypothetical protein